MSQHRWQLSVAAEQKERVVTFGTTTYRRIPYGEEPVTPPAPCPRPCRNCGVTPHQGLLHVYPCPGEVCPLCRDDTLLSCELLGCMADIRRAL